MTAQLISVASAVLIGDYLLRVHFEDGTSRDVDFGAFLRKSLHPNIRKWLDPAAFSTFRVEYGDLVWGDYELCFPVADLYRGVIG